MSGKARYVEEVFLVFVSVCPCVGLEAVVQLSQQLSVNQRSQVVKLLTTVDDLNTTCSSIDET